MYAWDLLGHLLTVFVQGLGWASAWVAICLAPQLQLSSFEFNFNLLSVIILMTLLSDSPTLSTKSNLEQTSTGSPATQEPLIINGMVVPTGPRAERVGISADPFVTPTRGIEIGSPPRPRDSATVASSEPQAHMTPTPSGFTPRADRLAEVISADNAQAIYPPQACVFVAKYVQLSSLRLH